MGILDGKNIVVAGVTMNTSIGYHAAEIAQREGANVIVTNIPRACRLTRRVVSKLDPVPPVLELDVNDEESLAGFPAAVAEHFDHVDGLVHSIAYGNPEHALGGKFLETEWEYVGEAVKISAFSLKSLTMSLADMMSPTAAVVGLTFDATKSWPTYDWMGVAKAALESTNRYLSRYLGPRGVRCNLVAAGPVDTIAKKAIPGAGEFNEIWGERAPLGWDAAIDGHATGLAVVALLSDFFPKTSGEIVHVDGGMHACGA